MQIPAAFFHTADHDQWIDVILKRVAATKLIVVEMEIKSHTADLFAH